MCGKRTFQHQNVVPRVTSSHTPLPRNTKQHANVLQGLELPALDCSMGDK